jgi:hypothetical protein
MPGRRQRLLTTREAAAYLSVSPYTLELWRTRKQRCGPRHYKIHSHCIRYCRADLDMFLEGRAVEPGRRPAESKRRDL